MMFMPGQGGESEKVKPRWPVGQIRRSIASTRVRSPFLAAFSPSRYDIDWGADTMFEREHWPYIVVLAITFLSWVTNTFIDDLRKTPTLDYTISIGNAPNTTATVVLENISSQQMIGNFDLVVRADIDVLARDCAHANSLGLLQSSTESNIVCDHTATIPVALIPPATALAAEVTFNGRSKTNPTFQLDLKSDASPVRIVSKNSATSLFLRNQSGAMVAAFVLALAMLVVGVARNWRAQPAG